MPGRRGSADRPPHQRPPLRASARCGAASRSRSRDEVAGGVGHHPVKIDQKRSINRGSHAREVQRDDLDPDAQGPSLPRFLEHRVERVRLGPAVFPRVELVRNGSCRVDGSSGTVRIDAGVWRVQIRQFTGCRPRMSPRCFGKVMAGGPARSTGEKGRGSSCPAPAAVHEQRRRSTLEFHNFQRHADTAL
jgi:hypothetical protein